MLTNSSHRTFVQYVNTHRALSTFGGFISTTNNKNENISKTTHKTIESFSKINNNITQQKIYGRSLLDRWHRTMFKSTNFTLDWITLINRNLSTKQINKPQIQNINVHFNNGHFKFQFFNQYQTILGFWQTCSEICSIIEKEIVPNYKKDDNIKIDKYQIVSEEADGVNFLLAPSMPIGFLFGALDTKTLYIEGRDKEGKYLETLFGFHIEPNSVEIIKLWSETHMKESFQQGQRSPKPKSSFIQHEISFLEQERQQLKNEIAPMRVQFEKIVQISRSEAHRNFKIGGLFLLSAQLGFVGRLTYFEYSWDIMEPVTWILTYSLMVGSYAYYMITSEEYLVPSVERRIVVDRFWKLAKSHNFDADTYRQLRERILKLDRQIHKLNTKLSIAH